MKALLLMFCLNTATTLSDMGDYETSQKILNYVKPTAENHGKYCFYRAVNAYALNQKADCIKYSNLVVDSFNKTERRYEHVASLMLLEATAWKDNDIGDVGRDMKVSADRLENAKAGKDTQAVQKKIMDKLDRLIKEQEDALANAKAGKNPDGSPIPGKGQMPGMPQPDSFGGDFAGKGDVTEKQLKKLGEEWGKMPPLERAKAMQEISKDLPPKFKPMIQQYFESLSKIQDKP